MSSNVVTPPVQEQEQFCPVCKKPAKQRCSGCKSIYYCTKEHQKSHWKSHSKDCRVFELAEDSVIGRHYIATRNIKAGDLVLREEKPLIEVPHLMTVPVCLGCYDVLSIGNAKPCNKCGWPLCLSCKKHGSECGATIKYLKSEINIHPKYFQTIHQKYNVVIVLRALALRDDNPKAYRRYLGLDDQSQRAENMEAVPHFGTRKSAAGLVKSLMKPRIVEEDEIAKIIGIVMVNGHGIRVPNSHTAVFDRASYFEHNCRANCAKSSTDDGGIVIRAAVPIAKGDHITISYTHPLWGVVKRRNILATTKFFDCTCERCSDPTEFGTMFNAIKCVETKCTGYMLPETFLAPKDEYPDFVCLKCKVSTPWLSVKAMLQRISAELECLQNDNVQSCKRFIQKHTKLLHENHFYMFSARLDLAGAIGDFNYQGSNVSDDLLAEKITICKKLEVLMKILMPGENRMRGTLLFHLYASLIEHSGKQLPDWAAFTKLAEEANTALVEAYNLLRDEPLSTKEGRMGRQAQLLLQKDTKVIPG